MRVHKLLTELKNFLEAALADFALPDPATDGADRMGCVQCFFGNVPDDGKAALPERFPFVVIRWVDGESREDGENMEQVALILGVYAPDGPGEAELITAMLMDHLRSAFMHLRILASTFDLQLPLEAAKPDPEKRQHNYHIATIITRWQHTSFRRPIHTSDFLPLAASDFAFYSGQVP